jgi:hypothetical protein
MQAFLIVFLFLLSSAVAFPTYTGGCNTGNPLGDPHTKSPSSGFLSAIGLQLRIGTKNVPTGSSFTFKSGTSHPISIISTKNNAFRGFQIRISKGTTDTTTWLKASADSNVQVDQFCNALKVGGICHNSNSDKLVVAGILNVPSAMKAITIEVTVVLDEKPSVWYKSNFKVIAK